MGKDGVNNVTSLGNSTIKTQERKKLPSKGNFASSDSIFNAKDIISISSTAAGFGFLGLSFISKGALKPILQSAGGLSLLIGLIGIFLSFKENSPKTIPDDFKQVADLIEQYNHNSDYNSPSAKHVATLKEDYKKSNYRAYSMLMQTNCSEQTIRQLKNEGNWNDTIASWADGYLNCKKNLEKKRNNPNLQFNEKYEKVLETAKGGFQNYCANRMDKEYYKNVLKVKENGFAGYLATRYKSVKDIQYLKNNLIQDVDPTNDKQDGIIGSFQQGQIGDCYFLATLEANKLSAHKDIFKNLITNNKNGTFTVRFAGIKEYIEQLGVNVPEDMKNKIIENGLTVTEEELKSNKCKDINDKVVGSFSTGDKDVRILEIAFHKLCLKLEKRTIAGSDCLGHRNVKLLLKREKDDKRIWLKKDGLLNEKVKKIIKGFHNKPFYFGSIGVTDSEIRHLDEKRKIHGNHAYTLASVDYENQIIVIINPHDNNERIPLSFKEFSEQFEYIEPCVNKPTKGEAKEYKKLWDQIQEEQKQYKLEPLIRQN